MPADPSNDLLLVTCASGKQASTFLRLLTQWKRLRLVVNTAASKERLEQLYPHAEVVQTDLYNPANCTAIFEGVNVAVHIGPTAHAHEQEIGIMMVDAAMCAYRDGTLRHLIYSSVLGSQLFKLFNHVFKNRIEEQVLESGLPFTIVQPCRFMDNVPVSHMMQMEEPVLPMFWNPSTAYTLLARKDFGEAVAKIINEREKHFRAQYPLVSMRNALSYTEMAAMLSKKLGKDVKVTRVPQEEAVATAMKWIMPNVEEIDPRTRDIWTSVTTYYENRGLQGNPNVLEWLLERKATQFEEWMDEVLAERGA